METITPGDLSPDSILPPPGAEEWSDLEDEDLATYVKEHETKLDGVRKFVTIAENQYKFVFFGDSKESIKIKVKAAIPYEVRDRQKHLQEELQEMYRAAREKAELLNIDPDKVQINDLKLQRPMYEILADLCIEEPWNDWRTWAVIDRGVKGKMKGSGMGPVMLKRIFDIISETKEDVKSFRGK